MKLLILTTLVAAFLKLFPVCILRKVIMEVCEAIVTHLVPKYITPPKTREEMTSKVSQFELKFGMRMYRRHPYSNKNTK